MVVFTTTRRCDTSSPKFTKERPAEPRRTVIPPVCAAIVPSPLTSAHRAPGPGGPCAPGAPGAPGAPCGPRLPLSCLIALFVRRFLAIVCGLIFEPLISAVDAAYDAPPRAKNSATSAIPFRRRKRPKPPVMMTLRSRVDGNTENPLLLTGRQGCSGIFPGYDESGEPALHAARARARLSRLRADPTRAGLEGAG